MNSLEPWYLKVPVGALAMAAVVLLAVKITRVEAPLPASVPLPSAAHDVPHDVSHDMPPASFPMDAMQPAIQERNVPFSGLRLHVRLYAQDVMAANDQVRRLLVEIPAKLVEPPLPIHYELSLRPERVETFLECLKRIASSMDLKQESVASPEGDSAAQITVDIFSSPPS